MLLERGDRRADDARRLRRRAAAPHGVRAGVRHRRVDRGERHRRDRQRRRCRSEAAASTAPASASLVCAPLKVGERVIGAIALGSAAPAAYTAGELKLLNTLALQTATAIENARLFERTVQAALASASGCWRANKEMELAARIQADLFPAAMPGARGLDLAARNRPARRCGGDYYDALLIEGARWRAARAALRRRRVGQGDAGGAADEPHAGDAARAARAAPRR